MFSHNIEVWIGFNLFVALMLTLDLGVFHKKAHTIGFKESILWTVLWITLALTFNAGIYFWMSKEAAVEFFTGYVIEKSLSVDNIFVILMIFNFFRIENKYQHKVLFWGIIGALVMRAVFIFAGVALLERYHWIMYVFGGVLVLSGIKMALPQKEMVALDENIVLKTIKKFVPFTHESEGANFFVKKDKKRFATPLFATLLMVETTDLIFAIDSIPAVLAVSSDPFIVYTSNVFAILGLRSLYFAIAGLCVLFHHLKYGLSLILLFVGAKMLLVDVFKIPTFVALAVILGILALSILASVLWPPKKGEAELACPLNLTPER